MEEDKILLVEDDQHLGYLLSENLTDHKYKVKWLKDGNEAFDAFSNQHFDLCLLDVIVPGIDGLELAKRIKRLKPEMPIIFITARSLKSDVIAGYDTGCDDYIIKPFEVYHLILKVKAVIARKYGRLNSEKRQYKIGDISLDTYLQVITINDKKHKLNRIECQVLAYFLSANGEVVTRNFLLESIWGRNDIYTSKSLDTYLSRIRKYLKAAGISLENIYGVGYILKALNDKIN